MPAKQRFQFGKKFAELEEITKAFEQGDIDLEKSFKQFERGLKLAGELKNYLQTAETNIIRMKEKFSKTVD